MIDHRYFPHLVDSVFAHAPAESLFVMSQVCKDWREKAVARFERVARFKTQFAVGTWDFKYLIKIGALPAASSEDTASSEDGAINSKKEGHFQRARLLDFYGYCGDEPSASVTLQRLAPNLQTIRYDSLTPSRLPSGFVSKYTRAGWKARLPEPECKLPAVERIVFLDVCLPKSITLSDRNRKLVFNHCQVSGKLYDLDLDALSTRPGDDSLEIVYIFPATPMPRGPDDDRMWYIFGNIVEIVHYEQTRSQSPPHLTVVGAENQFGLLNDYEFWVEDNLLVNVEDVWEGVSVLTLPAYRQLLGEQEFALETTAAFGHGQE